MLLARADDAIEYVRIMTTAPERSTDRFRTASH
jgi:hypothetical protein